MADEKKEPDRPGRDEDQRPATFGGESLGSGPNTATGLGRGGDVIVQDDIVYGRPVSGRDRAKGDRAPDQQGTGPDRGAQESEPPDRDR